MERHNGIELDPEGAFVYYADAQATVEAAISDRDKQQDISKALYQQVEALQRERDILLRQVDTQRRTIQRYQASRHEHTQLQALVRALVCTRTYMVDGEYIRTRGGSVLYACSSSISAERLGALLAYRATLPATPTEEAPVKGGDGE